MAEDDGSDGSIADAADAGEEQNGPGDGDMFDGSEEDDCQTFEIRVAACTAVVMGGWVPCPDNSRLPDECREDCTYIDKPQCLQWWVDNICIWFQEEMQSLNPDFSTEKVMLVKVVGELDATATEIEGEICPQEEQIVVDVCELYQGSMGSGTLFAIAIPKVLDPSVVTRTVFCGEFCEQTEWCGDAGASKDYSCSPDYQCPP